MQLKAKLLQVTKEKEELASKSIVEVSPPASQQIDTIELTRSLAQASLKDKEISQLIQEKKSLEKPNQEKQERIDKLKARLVGKEALKLAQHSLQDMISIEVNKFWGELRRMEAKKAYIYSSLEKHKLAIEQLAHVHKEPVEKSQSIINFLMFSSYETLQAFKANDRFQTIMLVKRVIDKDEMIRKVKNGSKALQKEIKEIYSLFNPLIDKGMPHLWDVENKLLKKENMMISWSTKEMIIQILKTWREILEEKSSWLNWETYLTY